jgi:hypothetical protein
VIRQGCLILARERIFCVELIYLLFVTNRALFALAPSYKLV